MARYLLWDPLAQGFVEGLQGNGMVGNRREDLASRLWSGV